MPHHTHDCDRCVHFGTVDWEGIPADLYWCAKPEHPSLDSVLVRYGSNGPEYWSAHPPEAFADPEGFISSLRERNHPALVLYARAAEAGLYKGPHASAFRSES